MTRKGSDFEKHIKLLYDKALDDSYAIALYASLCNIIWVHRYTGKKYSCTWRYAGGLVAKLRNKGEEYIDFYISGYEGSVREDVYKDLSDLGWKPTPYPGHNVVIRKSTASE